MEMSNEIMKIIDSISNVEWTYSDDYHIYFESSTFYYEVCAPHYGNGYNWMFRKGRIKGFDRWANSCCEYQEYPTFDELVSRLKKLKYTKKTIALEKLTIKDVIKIMDKHCMKCNECPLKEAPIPCWLYCENRDKANENKWWKFKLIREDIK